MVIHLIIFTWNKATVEHVHLSLHYIELMDEILITTGWKQAPSQLQIIIQA